MPVYLPLLPVQGIFPEERLLFHSEREMAMELFFGKTFDRFFPTYFIEKLEV